MKLKKDMLNLTEKPVGEDENSNLSGYPGYPAGEDIYRKDLEEKEIDPEEVSKKKNSAARAYEKEDQEDVSGDDLDVPGSELDDDQEDIGNEDEENNYYSLSDDEEPDEEE